MRKKEINPGKTYKTRNGKDVRIYATDGCKKFGEAIHGAILTGDGWESYTWKADGSVYGDVPHINDLVEVNRTLAKSFWVNILEDESLTFWNSRAEADADMKPRLACFHIEMICQVGHGLENSEN